MEGLKTDSLRVDCLKAIPKDFDWSEGYGDTWDVVPPFFEEDFNEEETPNAWRENEEKTGFSDFYEMEDSNTPMMSYYYPLYHMDSFDSEDAKKLRGLNLCLVQFYYEDNHYALALTGGGMDFSWQICEAHIRLGYYPPIHFRLPRMAGKENSKKNRKIVEACIKGREIVTRWMSDDIKDLDRVLDFLVRG